MAGELLGVRGLCKRYRRRAGPRSGPVVQALEDVDLSVAAGSTTAVVGESGSGKSTLARCLARLEEPDSGDIRLEGRSLISISGPSLLQARRQIQLIFQDAAMALNPRLGAGEIVEEPLLIMRRGGRPERRRRTLELLERVGLPAAWEARRPFELSGGQRQRLAIARALAVEPRVLILDEALSGLDVSSQAQIVNLLMDLRAASPLTCLYISHDLGLMARIADEVVVLYHGRVVEHGGTAAVLGAPRHPHTRSLVAAIPALPA
jgi:ABC-type glutathione transport system ATPase component